MQLPMIRIGVFTGLVLVFPCPWYMIAVGGLFPLPVILAFGLSGPIQLAFSLAHAALYTWLFSTVARRVDSIVRANRIRPGMAGALLVSGFVVLSFAPIYGGGENLLGINKIKHNAYEIYRDTLVDVFGGGRREVMELRRRLLPITAVFALTGTHVSAETITDARYAAPVDRYGHFALGRPHEYAHLTATTSTARTLTLLLPEDEVFEDLAPRLVSLATHEPTDILAVVSRRDSGARLVMIRLSGDRLVIHAQSPAIGTPMRWLNPVGVADLDGDGRAEIAAVITPHIGGTLKVYRQRGGELVEIAALAGFSNHVYGSPELALSAPVSIAGRMRLLVPDATRLHLRILALESDRLVEKGRCPVSAPITGALKLISPREVSVGVLSGRQVVVLDECLK